MVHKPSSSDDTLSPEGGFENCQAELELLLEYRAVKDSFLKLPTPGEQLAMVKDHFKDSEVIMVAYERAITLAQDHLKEEQRRYPIWGITWESMMGNTSVPIRGLSDALYYPIADYVRKLEARTCSDFAFLLLSEIEFIGLKTLAQRFIERGDLTKPFEDHRWNWHKTFPTQINRNDYEATLVVSPDSAMKTDFMIGTNSSEKKRSVTIALDQLNQEMAQKTPLENLRHDLVQMGLGLVEGFLNHLKRQRQVMSGEAYPTIDVFSTALNLNAGVPLNEKGAYSDPTAAYALSLEMARTEFLNLSLNAMEYAACSPGMDVEKLRDLPNKPAQFVYHVVRGLLNLYKHMLVEANGDTGCLRVMPIEGGSATDGGTTYDARSEYGNRISASI